MTGGRPITGVAPEGRSASANIGRPITGVVPEGRSASANMTKTSSADIKQRIASSSCADTEKKKESDVTITLHLQMDSPTRITRQDEYKENRISLVMQGPDSAAKVVQITSGIPVSTPEERKVDATESYRSAKAFLEGSSFARDPNFYAGLKNIESGKCIWLTETFMKHTGYHRDQWINKRRSCWSLVHPDDLPRVSAQYAALCHGHTHGCTTQYHLRFKSKENKYIRQQMYLKLFGVFLVFICKPTNNSVPSKNTPAAEIFEEKAEMNISKDRYSVKTNNELQIAEHRQNMRKMNVVNVPDRLSQQQSLPHPSLRRPHEAQTSDSVPVDQIHQARQQTVMQRSLPVNIFPQSHNPHGIMAPRPPPGTPVRPTSVRPVPPGLPPPPAPMEEDYDADFGYVMPGAYPETKYEDIAQRNYQNGMHNMSYPQAQRVSIPADQKVHRLHSWGAKHVPRMYHDQQPNRNLQNLNYPSSYPGTVGIQGQTGLPMAYQGGSDLPAPGYAPNAGMVYSSLFGGLGASRLRKGSACPNCRRRRVKCNDKRPCFQCKIRGLPCV